MASGGDSDDEISITSTDDENGDELFVDKAMLNSMVISGITLPEEPRSRSLFPPRRTDAGLDAAMASGGDSDDEISITSTDDENGDELFVDKMMLNGLVISREHAFRCVLHPPKITAAFWR